MKLLRLDRYALSAAIILLAGCGGSETTSALQVHPMNRFSAHATAEHGYESLYSFKAYSDGDEPLAGLLRLNGALYGTTWAGGDASSHSSGQGTVFTITKAGKERVQFRFNYLSGGGYHPGSDFAAVKGSLYSVAAGGNSNGGVVYAVTTSGDVSVVYAFKGKPDGFGPAGSLTTLDGNLYGATVDGGTGRCHPSRTIHGCGTVYEINASGTERVVYSFKRSHDGDYPAANLVAVKGVLYGTTVSGAGGSACSYSYGCGTVFSVSTSGNERVLYRFKGPPYDGQPTLSSNGLVALENVLYGTTAAGGTSRLGIVYSIALSGKEILLHNFTGSPDGATPSARLVAVDGVLYGTTYAGGTSKNCSGGCGTVFKISTSGKEQVLYSFQGYPSDGSAPLADLTLVSGRLYGTTSSGGSAGAGTVFRILP